MSFGLLGVEEGYFVLHVVVCMCTDKDGFVYVADYRNNRVQCY